MTVGRLSRPWKFFAILIPTEMARRKENQFGTECCQHVIRSRKKSSGKQSQKCDNEKIKLLATGIQFFRFAACLRKMSYEVAVLLRCIIAKTWSPPFIHSFINMWHARRRNKKPENFFSNIKKKIVLRFIFLSLFISQKKYFSNLFSLCHHCRMIITVKIVFNYN